MERKCLLWHLVVSQLRSRKCSYRREWTLLEVLQEVINVYSEFLSGFKVNVLNWIQWTVFFSRETSFNEATKYLVVSVNISASQNALYQSSWLLTPPKGNLETRSETPGRKSVLELCRLSNVRWDDEPEGKLTAASPVVRLHFLLANGIDNRTHVGSCLWSIYLVSIFSHNIIAHCSSIFCVSIHFARPQRDVPVVAWFLRCSLHFTHEEKQLSWGMELLILRGSKLRKWKSSPIILFKSSPAL